MYIYIILLILACTFTVVEKKGHFNVTVKYAADNILGSDLKIYVYF